MSKCLLFLFLFFMPFSRLRWFQSFFSFAARLLFLFLFFMPFSWSWAVFLLFLSFFLGALHFVFLVSSFFFLFLFFHAFFLPCVDSSLSSLSFLFSGGLVSTVVFLFFFSFFWGPCVDSCLSSFSFFFWRRCILFILFLASFSFFFFRGGTCVSSLSLSLSPSIAWTSRSK